MTALDVAFTAVLGGLVIVAPLALGSLYPVPLRLLEVGMFVLVLLVMAKCWALRSVSSSALQLLAPPGSWWIGLLLGFLVLQGIALPPAAQRAISAQTYQFYMRVLPGWPRQEPYTDFQFGPAQASPVVTREELSPRAVERSAKATWYPVSLAPSLSRSATLEAFAWAAGFVAIVGFRFADEIGKRRFETSLLHLILISGVVVAILGILSRVYWNGKVLWFFIPPEWGMARPSMLPRANGPFINADHFANFLAMVFPLTLAGAIFGVPRRSESWRLPMQWLSAGAALIVLSGILLSLSRGAWFGTVIGMMVFTGFLARSHRWENADSPGRPGPHERSVSRYRSAGAENAAATWLPFVGFLALLGLALLFIGAPGTQDTQARIVESVGPGGGGDLWIRFSLWRDSLTMLRYFPLLGVGLGAWPVIFPHIQSGPWSLFFFREAHNDYIQYVAETGLVGALLLILVLVSIGRALARARVAQRDLPIFAALLAALSAMACHEFFDCSLHVPANALLCTVLVASAVRLAGQPAGTVAVAKGEAGRSHVFAAGLSLLAVFLIIAALERNQTSYPYDLSRGRTERDAHEAVLAHPMRAQAHLRLADFFAAPGMQLSRLREVASAVWLDPLNPYARDRYAWLLVRAGQPVAAMAQVQASVFGSPGPDTHLYLSQELVMWTTPQEQKAIERGYRQAIAANYPGAVEGLATVYQRLGRYPDAAQLYASAAQGKFDSGTHVAYLESAGEDYARAGEDARAEAMFRAAIVVDPANTAPYESLVSLIYGPAGKLNEAKELIEQGVAKGANPAALYSSLGAASQAAADQAGAERAWLRALDYDPSFAMTRRVGEFYLRSKQFDQAARMLGRATEMDPTSAETYYLLGQAEEGAYQYSEADKAYGRAAKLSQAEFGRAYAEFRRRMDVSVGIP